MLAELLLAGLLVQRAPAQVQPEWPPIPPRIKPALKKAIGTTLSRPLDNLSGNIAWLVPELLNACLESYGATGDREYLDLYLPLAEAVVRARADQTGARDWEGRIRKGWLANGAYTLGAPYLLLDASGKPSFEIRTVANSGNHEASLEVIPNPADKTFTVIATFGFRRNPPLVKRYEGLTAGNAEARVNAKPGEPAFVRLVKKGSEIPRPYGRFKPGSAKMVFHGVHTGRIAAPLARFAALVKGRSALAAYREAAARHATAAEESMRDGEDIWREDGDRGYFIMPKGGPFWLDGYPQPHNMQSAAGTAYIGLFDATGKPDHKRRAAMLARQIKLGLRPGPEGTLLHRYFLDVLYRGIEPQDGVSVNTPKYKAKEAAEDTAHFQLTARFMAECYERGIVFEKQDMERLAATFHQRVFRSDGAGRPRLAERIDGTSRSAAQPESDLYSGTITGFALLGRFDGRVAERCRFLFERRFPDFPAGQLYGWAILAAREAGK